MVFFLNGAFTHHSLGGGNSNIFGMFTPKIGGRKSPILTVRIFVKWVGEKPPTRSFIHSPEAITSSQVGVGGDLSTDDVLQLAPFLGRVAGEARSRKLRGEAS